MADDKKPKKSGMGDKLKEKDTGDDVIMKLVGDMGITMNDVDLLKSVKKDIESQEGVTPGTGSTGIGMADTDFSSYIQPETITNHAKLVAQDYSPTALFGKADAGLLQKASDLDMTGKMNAYAEGLLSSQEVIKESPEWQKSENYMGWGGGVLGAGAALGVPGLALIGLLLRGTGARMQNQMMSSYNRGVKDLLADDDGKRKVGDNAAIDRAVVRFGERIAVAKVRGDEVEAMKLEQGLRNVLTSTYDMEGDELTARIADARATELTEEEKLGYTGTSAAVDDARKKTDARINKMKDDTSDVEKSVIKKLEAGSLDDAVAEFASEAGLEGQEATGYMANEVFLKRFGLDDPVGTAEVAGMKGDAKYYQRNFGSDPILKKFVGHEPEPSDMIQKGEVTDADIERVPSLKHVDRFAPIIKQVNQWLFGVIGDGRFGDAPGGGRTFYAKLQSRTAFGKAGLKRLFGETPLDEVMVQLVDKSWPKDPTMGQVYAALDELGMSAALSHEVDPIAEALR